MGRYNLTVAKNALGDHMTKADFADIFGIGALVYGFAFVINGPLTDRMGGRFSMLLGTFGAIIANLLMGLLLYGKAVLGWDLPVYGAFIVLYAMNMYFQSFGAVAIVTVKAPWFHVRERGSFSTIFSLMISLGIYFAFDWGYAIMQATRKTLDHAEMNWVSRAFHAVMDIGGHGQDANWWLFFTPALALSVLWAILFVLLKNKPSEAGFDDFDTGEEAISGDGERMPVREVFWKLITHPVLGIICIIEFSSGVLRNGIMHWYIIFAKELGFYHDFAITENWGLSLLIAGVLGGLLTGWASDRFFQSRRAPMAAILYGIMLVSVIAMALTLSAAPIYMGISVLAISMAVIGVHGIMSGTSTVDFGGTKNAGAAVGVVDGLVYLGTGLQSFVIGHLVPTGEAAKDPSNWSSWPLFLIPFALLGLFMAIRIWNAIPKKAESQTA